MFLGRNDGSFSTPFFHPYPLTRRAIFDKKDNMGYSGFITGRASLGNH
jgi:hypothetical protein